MADSAEKASCGHRECAGSECPKCGTPPCCWHDKGCDHYRQPARVVIHDPGCGVPTGRTWACACRERNGYTNSPASTDGGDH